MTNEYVYEYKGDRKRINLPVGCKSRVSEVETDLVYTNFSPEIYREMKFIADVNGSRDMSFFSTRGAYKLMNIRFPYIEVKGCGVPNKGISNEYFLEDGRDEDKIQDPIGGFSLEKALVEWEMLERLWKEGVQTHIPISLLRLRNIKGPIGEDLALLVRSGKSNVRLSYLEGMVLGDMKNVRDDTLYSLVNGTVSFRKADRTYVSVLPVAE